MSFSPETRARPTVQSAEPYQAGVSTEEIARTYSIPLDQIIKLGSNENPFGMSPKAAEAAQKALANGNRYPDNRMLLETLGKHYDVGPGQIVLGNGSTEVIDMIARAFLGPDDEAISSQYAFAMFATMTHLSGAKNIIVPAKEFAHDLVAMLAAVTKKTRVIWIASPNNPTGTFVPYDALKAFIEKVPDDVIVVVDEAYHHYLEPDLRQDATKWLSNHPNLILLRTFSKIYGLAGLRIGYGIMDERVATLLNRTKQPLNISSTGLAGAAAALEDRQFTAMSFEKNREGLEQLREGFAERGIIPIPAFGNFITIKVDDARNVNEQLLRQGIIVRPLVPYDMPNHLRVTVGTAQQNETFLKVLAQLPG